MECKDCGNRLITATAQVSEFWVDSEPYEAGVKEDCGFEIIDAFVSVGVLWCPQCLAIRHVWIAEA